MIDFEQQGAVGLHDERPGTIQGRRHQRLSLGLELAVVAAPALGDVSLLGSVAEGSGVGLSDGFGVADGVADGVGSGVGRVTMNAGELALWLPAASMARTCTTCWVAPSLNQRSSAWVCVVVATGKPSSQIL
jgi:hypothetical protein